MDIAPETTDSRSANPWRVIFAGLCASLIANGFGPRIETKESYAEVLRMATSRPEDEDKPGTLVHNARRQRVEGTMGEGFTPTDETA